MNEISQPRRGIEEAQEPGERQRAEHEDRLHRVEAHESVLALGEQQDDAGDPAEDVGQRRRDVGVAAQSAVRSVLSGIGVDRASPAGAGS